MGAPTAPETDHRHTWTGVELELVDGHPFVRQRCGCGAARSFRAFERYWDPARGDSDPAAGHSDPDVRRRRRASSA